MNNLQFGEFTLDRRLRELRRGESVISIPVKAFDLLAYMAANPGRPLSKAELLDAVWPETAVEESNLSQNVFLLRKVLGSTGDGPIKTLSGRGYQFAAEVSEADTLPAPHTRRVGDKAVASLTVEATETRLVVQDRVEEETPDASRKRVWLAVALLLLAALATLGWIGRQRWLDRSGGSPVQVVLAPFEGTTGDAVLDKALTQALRMDIAQSPYVSLVPGSTVRATLTQMMRKPDDPMALATAREVCERTNSQSVLSGNIARAGQGYLVTEEASSCVDGSVVGQAKSEAEKAEELPHAIDKVAATLRRELGESRRSIARFDTPLLPMSTASLDALKAYSQALALSTQGKYADAITLEKRALSLDPDFAAARFDLAAFYFSTGDFAEGRPALVKAYEVRDKASEPVRLDIIALYTTYITEDLYAAERNYRSWTELYPRSVQAWNGLSLVQRELGRHADSAATGLRTLELAPNNLSLYFNAAYEQMRSGDITGARATLDRAIAHKLDGEHIRQGYLQIATLQHDSALMKTEMDWVDAHPNAAASRIELIAIAIGEGRLVEAQRQLAQATLALRQQGLGAFADSVTKQVGLDLDQAGDREDGLRLFRSVPVDPEEGSDLEGLVEFGDLKTAAADLHAVQLKFPDATVWKQYYGPRVEAGIALANHKPQDAITIMEATRPLDARDFDTSKFRGDAYLAAGQPALAEKEYRWVVTHREIEPDLSDYPLSWLGLGEALAAQGKKQDAVDAYQHFFTLWAHADPGAKYLIQARQEFAQLQSATSVH